MAGDDAEQWRQRAAQARAEAARTQNADARRALIEVAEACERVARAIDGRTDERPGRG